MIRDLVVSLTGNNDRFKKTVKESRGLLASMATDAKVMMGGLTAVMSTLAVAGGSLAATFLVVKGRLTAIADLADRAERAGVGAGWLRTMEHAADMAGVSADKLGSAMNKLTMQIGKAKAGAEPVQQAFEKLGLDMARLQSMKTEDVFLHISDRIAKMPDPADRTALAMEIFGKQAAELIPLLNQGADGLAAMAAEAEALGLVLTDEEIKAAAEADDAIQKLSKSFSALIDKLAIDFAPGISSAIEDLLTMRDAIKELDASLMDWNVTLSNLPFNIGVELADEASIGGFGAALMSGSFTQRPFGTDFTDILGGKFGELRAEEQRKELEKIAAQQRAELKRRGEEEKKQNEEIAKEKIAAEEKARQDAVQNRLDRLTAGGAVPQFDLMGQIMGMQVDELLSEIDRTMEAEKLQIDGSINQIVESPQVQQAGFAASAQKGSAEAFSAINQAMAERDRVQQSLQRQALEAQQAAAEALQIIQTKLIGAPTLAIVPNIGGP